MPKKEIVLPTDPIPWQDIGKYLRGNRWIKLPSNEMFNEGGVLERYNYGDKTLIVCYNRNYVYQWFLKHLQKLDNSNALGIVNELKEAFDLALSLAKIEERHDK